MASIKIEWEGKQEVIGNLNRLADPSRFIRAMAQLSKETEKYWQSVTPKGKTGRLRGGDRGMPRELSFVMENPIFYYDFVSSGHNTPRGWRRKRHGKIVYVRAKRRSHVEGKHMTKKMMEFAAERIIQDIADVMLKT